MKTRRWTYLRPPGASLALALCYLAGCAAPGYQKADVAAVSMRKAATEVEIESRALDQTVGSLNALLNEPSGDLRLAFQRYNQSLSHLVASAERTERTGRNMQQKSASYLEAWSRKLQTIDYQHIRDLGDARWAEVTNRVETINRRYQESQAAVQPLISYLGDIRTALSADLTSAGLDSMKGVAQNAQSNVSKVRTALDALTAELTNSSARMSSVAYQAQAAPDPAGTSP